MKQSSGEMNRRRWLQAAGITAAASVPLIGTESAASVSPQGRRARNMQLSLAAYSVRQALTGGKMDLFGFIDWCAELDLPGTELTSYYFKEDFDAAYLRALRNRAFRNGVTISGTAIRNNFCLPPGEEKDREVAQVRKWIDHAAELFAPHIRIFAGDVPDGATTEQAVQWTADGVLSVLSHAEKRGVVVGLENHLGITARANDLLAICDKVGKHPWFGVNLDTGNYHVNPYEEVEMTVPWAVNAQVKVEVHLGEELVPTDLERVVKILVDGGYRGWVALEYEATGDPFVEIPKYLRELKLLLEA